MLCPKVPNELPENFLIKLTGKCGILHWNGSTINVFFANEILASAKDWHKCQQDLTLQKSSIDTGSSDFSIKSPTLTVIFSTTGMFIFRVPSVLA